MTNNESGRSMVEMLGVLAIIGVLSVMGIAGYTQAMKKYKANEILNTASMLAVIAKSANGGQGTASLTAANAGLALPAGATAMTATNCKTGGTCTISVTADDNDVLNMVRQASSSTAGYTIAS